ncbi:putative peptidoglycan-binding domain-containing protein [Brenneria populi subsp. brevivirga]|uniref:glycoside hydrolase family 108 protein n=1 Tax=Brenneria populi TaxID=1505588 RepID=UPI002E1961E7|nr:putative peptidoglycan-binding domain-containing protein [Brenneria populi subsp. brevivirga]
MTKDDIFNAILDREGGYVNHPADKGGATNWGVTEKVARAHGYTGDMQSLSRQQALEIYEADYWYGPRFDQVASLSPSIAAELCDTGINMGPSVPSKWFQRWLTALNDGGRLYPDLQPDGNIGPRTITALRQYMTSRGSEGEQVLLRALNCSQGSRYLELAEQRAANEAFLYGWVRERVNL